MQRDSDNTDEDKVVMVMSVTTTRTVRTKPRECAAGLCRRVDAPGAAPWLQEASFEGRLRRFEGGLRGCFQVI